MFMTDIFLSRPTFIPDNQKDGIDNFISLLDMMDLKPRTLGTTDYPNDAPLDEVLRILDNCSGMIVLGVSQICVENGSLKCQPIDGVLKLATEWNQIEAALAYSRKMPLLIIHDKGVSRGIFDRGTLGGFIHEVDFNDAHWSDVPSIKGALKTWKNKVVGYSPVKLEMVSSIDSSRKNHLLSLKNDFVGLLNRTYYYKKNNQSKNPDYDYSIGMYNRNCEIRLSDFLHREMETAYHKRMREMGNKVKNDVLNELNKFFPDVYANLVDLFNRDAFNKVDLDECFGI